MQISFKLQVSAFYIRSLHKVSLSLLQTSLFKRKRYLYFKGISVLNIQMQISTLKYKIVVFHYK